MFCREPPTKAYRINSAVLTMRIEYLFNKQLFGRKKGRKSHNLLIYTLICGERGKGTNLSYFVVLQLFSKFSQVVV